MYNKIIYNHLQKFKKLETGGGTKNFNMSLSNSLTSMLPAVYCSHTHKIFPCWL